MTPFFDGMYHTDEIPLRQIKRKLRIYGEEYTGGLIVDAWREHGHFNSVPRQWALQQGYTGENHTIRPTYNWKKGLTEYRYNQQECCAKMEQAIREQCGALLQAPTGWGKTVAGLEIARRFHTPTLVLVHKEDLVEQWVNTANNFFDESCGHIQGDRWDFEGHAVTVGMIQTFRSRGVDQIREHFGMIVVDEGHHIPCETVANILCDMPAQYRMGVSATWRRKDGLDNLWLWHIGLVAAKGVRPQIPATYYQIPVNCGLMDRQFMRFGRINHSNLVTAIAESAAMNSKIRKEVAEARRKGRNILIVTHRLKQVDLLCDTIKGAMPYTSKQKSEELDAAKKSDVLVSTFGKIAEGTDIPKLDTLILATPCSDPEQVYGRVSRDFPGKNTVIVVDLFAGTAYNYALAKKRERIYKSLNLVKG